MDFKKSAKLTLLFLWLPVILIGLPATEWSLRFAGIWAASFPVCFAAMLVSRMIWFKLFYAGNSDTNAEYALFSGEDPVD